MLVVLILIGLVSFLLFKVVLRMVFQKDYIILLLTTFKKYHFLLVIKNNKNETNIITSLKP